MMTSVRRVTARPTASVRQWAGRRLMTSSVGKKAGIFGITVLPKKLTMPLQRDELDPLPALTELRRTGPITKLSRVWGMSVWLVTGYEEAKAVLNDTTSYSSDIRALIGTGAEPIGGLGFTDPPDHTRLRKILTPEFTLRRLARLQPRIEQIVEERVDALRAGGDVVDLVSEFAFPIPFLMICDLLGLPDDERERFRSLGHARFDVNGGGAGTLGAVSQSREFLLDAVRRQRLEPGDGLIGSILRDHGDEIDDLELAGLADGVFTGGYETSASMLALGTLALLRDPAAFALIRTDPSAVDQIVDELLRYLSPVQIAFPRFARQDMELFGTSVKAGDVVVCSLTSANRDDVFGESPDAFDSARSGRSHLAFGHGFHRCIGSELARMELRVAFRALARSFPDLELAVPANALQFRELSIVYGVQSLPVRLNVGG
ncbi:cytochrome P450 [soil metagenome]|jgi:cytochrome P450